MSYIALVDVNKAYAYHIVRTARLLRLHFSRFAERAGFDITQEQWLIMNKLHQNPYQSQLELGDSLIHDKPNITRILAGMEKKKWIERRADSVDRRVMRVRLTTKGAAIFANFSQAVAVERDSIYAGLDESDLTALMKVLSQLEKNISNQI
jgi:DNA-binding MarR family transcriptional regulator